MKEQGILRDIVKKKKEKILLAKQNISEEVLKMRIQGLGPTRSFMKAINKPRRISLIAEIKKASVSRGIIRQDFNPCEIARIYEEVGVQAVSILTEEDYFLGDISYLGRIRKIVNLPILRKDFIIAPYQIYESRAFGCDALLLIAELLSRETLSEFLDLAKNLTLDCLVEVHTENDLKKAMKVGASLIGINNRNLHTLVVDFKTTQELYPLIPKKKLVVVESGIKTDQDILFLKVLGVRATLIGEAFMEAADIKARIKEIMGW
jgi:indole-3-glycerol phosphate synthase